MMRFLPNPSLATLMVVLLTSSCGRQQQLAPTWSPAEKFARSKDSLNSSFGVARLNGVPVCVDGDDYYFLGTEGSNWTKKRFSAPESIPNSYFLADPASSRFISYYGDARSRSTAEFFNDRLDQGESQDGQIIIGRDEHDRPVTLFFCGQIGSQSRAGFRVTKYHVGYALLGREFSMWQEVQFNSVRLDFTSLNFWLAFNPFDKHKFEDDDVLFITARSRLEGHIEIDGLAMNSLSPGERVRVRASFRKHTLMTSPEGFFG